MTSKKDNEIAISVKNVSKDFILSHQNQPSSIKNLFINPFSSVKNKTTEKQHALKDISFDVKKGEFFGIVGRNGSGKSTLLKIIAGIYKPNKGSVNIKGRLVPFIELGVGFNPELTGRENVYLSGALMGFSSNDVDNKYKDIVEFAELERFMDQKLKNYSSGMQVRLAFSVATVLADSDILLIDEVLAVGDADFQRKCFNYFKKLKKYKKTVVFVSHDMDAVRQYCDTVVLIDKSIIIDKGSPDVISEKYTQLFNANSSNTSLKKNKTGDTNRWGDGAARFESVDVSISNEYLTVKARVKHVNLIKNPIYGILIKNTAGETVCGTNSKILRCATKDNKENITFIDWTIPNIFTNGNYNIDVAVSYPDGITQADWWHEAASFEYYSNQQSTPHIVSPKILMKIH